MATGRYSIVRYRLGNSSLLVATGKTLAEAKSWCSRDGTHGSGWFDGYTLTSNLDTERMERAS